MHKLTIICIKCVNLKMEIFKISNNRLTRYLKFYSNYDYFYMKRNIKNKTFMFMKNINKCFIILNVIIIQKWCFLDMLKSYYFVFFF